VSSSITRSAHGAEVRRAHAEREVPATTPIERRRDQRGGIEEIGTDAPSDPISLGRRRRHADEPTDPATPHRTLTTRDELDRLDQLGQHDRSQPTFVVEAGDRHAIEVDPGLLRRGAPHHQLARARARAPDPG
jgi:hypothetical protein